MAPTKAPSDECRKCVADKIAHNRRVGSGFQSFEEVSEWVTDPEHKGPQRSYTSAIPELDAVKKKHILSGPEVRNALKSSVFHKNYVDPDTGKMPYYHVFRGDAQTNKPLQSLPSLPTDMAYESFSSDSNETALLPTGTVDEAEGSALAASAARSNSGSIFRLSHENSLSGSNYTRSAFHSASKAEKMPSNPPPVPRTPSFASSRKRKNLFSTPTPKKLRPETVETSTVLQQSITKLQRMSVSETATLKDEEAPIDIGDDRNIEETAFEFATDPIRTKSRREFVQAMTSPKRMRHATRAIDKARDHPFRKELQAGIDKQDSKLQEWLQNMEQRRDAFDASLPELADAARKTKEHAQTDRDNAVMVLAGKKECKLQDAKAEFERAKAEYERKIQLAEADFKEGVAEQDAILNAAKAKATFDEDKARNDAASMRDNVQQEIDREAAKTTKFLIRQKSFLRMADVGFNMMEFDLDANIESDGEKKKELMAKGDACYHALLTMQIAYKSNDATRMSKEILEWKLE